MQHEMFPRMERYSNTSSHGTSIMSTTSSQNEASIAEYWKQHNALKVSYYDDVLVVYDAFHKYLAQDTNDEAIIEEKRQFSFYLEHVHFCKIVLEEKNQGHNTRPWDDLTRVRKSIQNIILPYIAKITPNTPSIKSMNDSPPSKKVHVTWKGRRHNDKNAIRPVIQSNSISMDIPSSPSESYSSMKSDDDIDYWRQHAILREKQLANCTAVYTAFQQYLSRPPSASNPEQRQKLQYLLGFVEFCCQVLSETPSTHPPRPYTDYKRVLKSINKIITPYMQKLQMENQSQKSLPSVNDLFQRAAAASNASNIPPRQSSTATAYWQQHSQLKLQYLEIVIEAHGYFQAYLQHYSHLRSQGHIQDVMHLIDYAEYCEQVLEEKNQIRTMDELQHVYTYITTIIIPNYNTMQNEFLLKKNLNYSNSIISTNSTNIKKTDSFINGFDTDHISTVSSSLHRSTATTDSSMYSIPSITSSNIIDTTYWRKHGALKEIYLLNIKTAINGLQNDANEYSHAKSAAEARKLAALYETLENVQHCAMILQETEGTHPPRDVAELEQVHSCILQIVTPYCQRLESNIG